MAGLTLAVAQCPADLEGAEARAGWLTDVLGGHTGAKPDLVVLPELFQSGYNVGGLLAKRAEVRDGPFFHTIAQIAKRFGTTILYGYPEKDGTDLYNAAQCIDAKGNSLGHHRKLLLPPGFECDHFSPGSTSAAFELQGVRIATLICYDMEFPESLRHVAVEGADLVVVPTALSAEWGVVADCVAPARAFENGVYLAYANYCGHENGTAYFGGSCIVGPNGTALARAGQKPQLLLADVDPKSVLAAQTRLPYLKDRSRLPWVT